MASSAAEFTPSPDDVVIVADRLSKKVLRKGTAGDTPAGICDVNVHYVGKLLDGTPFDSSRDRGSPFQFKLGQKQVIKGWDVGVATMEVGELSLFTIHPEYAYGKRGSPPKIPANAWLTFEVELLSWAPIREKVSEDGGVAKQTISKDANEYNKPNDGATCRYNLIVSVGTAKESKEVHRIENATTIVGDDLDMPAGLEEAFRYLTRGEKANFFVQPHWGYGAAGKPEWGITATSPVIFTVELLDFTKGKATYEMNIDEKAALMNKKKTQGNHYWKANQLEKASARYTAGLKVVEGRKLEDDELKVTDPVKIQLLTNLALVASKQGAHDKVIEYTTDALKIDPRHAKSLYKRGEAHHKRKAIDDAIKDLTLAASLDSDKGIARELAAVKKVKADEIAKEKKLFGGWFGKVSLTDDEPRSSAAAAPAKTSSSSSSSSGAATPSAASAPAAAAVTQPAPVTTPSA